MTEPITTQKSFIVPNTGDLTGAWGTSALNPNFQTLDALFGGITTISLSSATTILLTVPATTGVWPGGLSQSVNSLIRFTGAQTGNAVIQFTLPGFYIIENQCTGTSSIKLQPSNLTGNAIGAIPGKKQHVFFDGTHMDYFNLPDPGTAYDLHINTTTLPPWMTVCTIAPYLIKDGSVYSTSTYPALAQYLGSTFGGNGVTTFGVPDERNRMRVPVDTVQAASGTTSNRITSTYNGKAFAASGGDELLQAHRHANSLTDPGHAHSLSGLVMNALSFIYQAGGSQGGQGVSGSALTGTTSITINNATTGAGGGNNMVPSVVSFLALVKT